MYSIIDPQPSNSSETTYKVYAGNYQDKVFDRWEDGSTDSVRTLAISDDKTITAYYRANAAGPAVHMDDTTVSTGQSVWTGRLAHAEYVTEESSLVGKQINSMTMTLKKSGSPTGTAEVGIINEDLSTKSVFATLDVSTLTASYTSYEFSSPSLYTIAAGDRIGIKYPTGTSSVNISIMRDTNPADPFDGSNSYHMFYTTSWSTFLENDLTMTLKLR
jgi:hypothetical protein